MRAMRSPTTLTHTASGADYDSAAVANLVVTVTDDDRAGLTLTPPTLMLAEGTTTTYTVVLDTEPSGPVMVTIDPGSEVTTSTTTLNFTSLTWAAAQTVTLTAEEDADARDEDPTTLTHTASGANYDSAAVANLVVTVTRRRPRRPDADAAHPDAGGRHDHHLYRGARHRAEWPGDGDHRSRERGDHVHDHLEFHQPDLG